jgi:hypothetical protein
MPQFRCIQNGICCKTEAAATKALSERVLSHKLMRSMCVYIYIYTHTHIYIYIYMTDGATHSGVKEQIFEENKFWVGDSET